MYNKYNGSWSGPISLDQSSGGSSAQFYGRAVVIDSSDNVHVVYAESDDNPDTLYYRKYTESTDTWASRVSIENTLTGNNNLFCGLGVDSSDNIHLDFEGSDGDMQYLLNNGSWQALTEIIDEANGVAIPRLFTPIFPKIEGVSTQIPSAGYYFLFSSLTPSSLIKLHQSDGLTLQTPVTQNYSRDDRAALPTTDSNLDNLFTTTEYAEVAEVDDDFATQSATDQYSIYEFKNKGNAPTDNIVVTWVGQSNIAPSLSPVVLQIYNRDSATWETLDTNSTMSANANFSLSGTKTSSLSDYYDGSNWVSCRVYQLAA